MTIEIGSTIYGKDGKLIKIIVINNQDVRLFIDTCGDEVGLDVFAIASTIEVLFKSLSPIQRENLVKNLVGKNAK